MWIVKRTLPMSFRRLSTKNRLSIAFRTALASATVRTGEFALLFRRSAVSEFASEGNARPRINPVSTAYIPKDFAKWIEFLGIQIPISLG
jgi:hypothetical protein